MFLALFSFLKILISIIFRNPSCPLGLLSPFHKVLSMFKFRKEDRRFISGCIIALRRSSFKYFIIYRSSISRVNRDRRLPRLINIFIYRIVVISQFLKVISRKWGMRKLWMQIRSWSLMMHNVFNFYEFI